MITVKGPALMVTDRSNFYFYHIPGKHDPNKQHLLHPNNTKICPQYQQNGTILHNDTQELDNFN